MDILCICSVYEFLATGSNWKDYIIPFISPIIGVGGAYWVMYVQLNRQKRRDEHLESEQNGVLRSTHVINLKIIELKMPEITDQAKIVNGYLADLDKSFLYFDLHLDGIELILKQDYNQTYKSFRTLFYHDDSGLNKFLLSYNAVYSLNVAMKNINISTKKYISECSLVKRRLTAWSSDLVSKMKLVLQDQEVDEAIKGFIKTTFVKYNNPDTDSSKELQLFRDTCNELLRNNQEIHLSTNSNVITLILFLKDCMVEFFHLSELNSDQSQLLSAFIEICEKEIMKIKNFTDIHYKIAENSVKIQ